MTVRAQREVHIGEFYCLEKIEQMKQMEKRARKTRNGHDGGRRRRGRSLPLSVCSNIASVPHCSYSMYTQHPAAIKRRPTGCGPCHLK